MRCRRGFGLTFEVFGKKGVRIPASEMERLREKLIGARVAVTFGLSKQTEDEWRRPVLSSEKIAGDEWKDGGTGFFAEKVAREIKRDGLHVRFVIGNKIRFWWEEDGREIPLELTLMEFGREGKSEGVNGRIVSPENAGFRLPGGWTRRRDAKELWEKARENLKDVFARMKRIGSKVWR